MMLQQPLLPNSNCNSSGDHTQRRYFWPLSAAAEAVMQHRWMQTLAMMPNSNSSNSSSSTQSVTSHPAAAAHDSIISQSAGLSSGTSCGRSASTTAAARMHTSPTGSTIPAAVPAAVSAAAVVPVMFGRQLAVSRSAAGAAWFDFLELCGRPLGAADYLAVAQNYHTVFISGECRNHTTWDFSELPCGA